MTGFGRDVPEASSAAGVPSPEAPADRAKAGADLEGTLALRLEYVLADPGGTRAVLRYVPETVHEFLADAKTGELLDLTELEEALGRAYDTAGGANGAAPAPMDAAADRGRPAPSPARSWKASRSWRASCPRRRWTRPSGPRALTACGAMP